MKRKLEATEIRRSWEYKKCSRWAVRIFKGKWKQNGRHISDFCEAQWDKFAWSPLQYWRKEGQMETLSNIFNEFVLMHNGSKIMRYSKGWHLLLQSYKGCKVGESFDRLRPELTRYIKQIKISSTILLTFLPWENELIYSDLLSFR